MLNIIDIRPLSFRLWGYYGDVPDSNYGEVGFRLMNAMWQSIQSNDVRNDGINHWVYLDKCRMFVGVGLMQGESAPEGLELLEFQLHRYAKHRHIGAYQELPGVWKTLMNELLAAGEKVSGPSLEVYGHQSNDPARLPETTILIALA